MKNLLSIVTIALLLTACSGLNIFPNSQGGYIPEEDIGDMPENIPEDRSYKEAEDQRAEDGELEESESEILKKHRQEDYPDYEDFSPGFDDFGNW